MGRSNFGFSVLLMTALCTAAQAKQIPVEHPQRPMHGVMVARSQAGQIIARVEFSQEAQGNEVNMRLTYRFADGSIDDETTTYTQQGAFRLVRNHHVESGPYFSRPFDFAMEAANGTATTRTTSRNGNVHVENEHVSMPDDLSNGFVGTLLVNVAQNAAPFRVGLLAPVGGGHLIRILISPDGERPFQMAGHTAKATVFRIHPELGGIVGLIAQLIGVQPKDVMVWVLEGEQPAVVRIVGQLGGYGPVVSSELEGTSFER